MWKYAHSSNKVSLSEHLLEYRLEASSLSYPILSRTAELLLAAVSASLITVSILVLLCTMTDLIGR